MKMILTQLTVVAMLACFISCTGTSSELKTESTAGISDESMIKSGEHLVEIMGCNDCHSPKIMGAKGPELNKDLLLSGHPSSIPLAKIDTSVLHTWVLFSPDLTVAAGPWGVTYAANITSDSTGIGGWKKEQFFKAMREGKHKGLDNSRPILPPMPWQTLSRLSDDELGTMFAYLKSVKPVHNVVPEAVPPGNMK